MPGRVSAEVVANGIIGEIARKHGDFPRDRARFALRTVVRPSTRASLSTWVSTGISQFGP